MTDGAAAPGRPGGRSMRLGIAVLVAAYALSQFYRAFLAVLAPALARDLGADAGTLSLASGVWFATFAAMQIPVGWALDRIGPRRTAAGLFALGGGGGAALFAAASAPWQLVAAMGLIGIGCSPVLMASYTIFARRFDARVFATLAALTLGLGSLGNLAGSAPLAWAAEAYGWRASVWAVAALTLGVAALVLAAVEDPPFAEAGPGGALASLMEIVRLRALWPVVALTLVAYAPAAGIRGLWIAPYLEDAFGAAPGTIGTASLVMALAMIAGSFAYGPLDRLTGTRKGVALAGNALCLAALLVLALMPLGLWAAVAAMAAVGFFGASYPLLMAHGRAFVPARLTGRGVTLINLFSIGGVGLAQVATGRIHAAADEPYRAVFLFFAGALALGLAAYAFSRDRTD